MHDVIVIGRADEKPIDDELMHKIEMIVNRVFRYRSNVISWL